MTNGRGMGVEAQSETRPEVIFRFVRQMLHERRITMQTYSCSVVERYHELVPAAARSVLFKTEGDVFVCAHANAKHLTRWMEEETAARIPVELEEAWVQALAEPYRTNCIRELVARYGVLAVAKPDSSGVQDMRSLGDLTKQVGEALEAVAPMVADGRFDAGDVAFAPEAIKQLDDIVSCAIALRETIKARTGAKE